MTQSQSDARERISLAIQEYLSLLMRSEVGGVATLGELARALDRLVMAYHETEDVEPDKLVSLAPRVGEKRYVDGAAAAFPELGWYALVDPEGDIEQPVGLTVATGDLGEIAVDLEEVLWLFQNAGENDAIWQFRWGYQNHWGRHLHELRVYLHGLAAW